MHLKNFLTIFINYSFSLLLARSLKTRGNKENDWKMLWSKLLFVSLFREKKSTRFKSCRNETVQLAYQSETRQRLLSFRFISPIKEVRKFWRFWVFEARGSNSLYFSSVKPLELIVFWDKTFPSVRKKIKWKCQKLMLKICWKVDSKMDF